MSDYPSSAKEAKKEGFKFYYTGKLCKNGHDSLRLASNCCCYECSQEQYSKWREENKEKFRKICKSWYMRNLEHNREKSRKWAYDNYERYLKNSRRGGARRKAKRRAAQYNATPGWSDEKSIQKIYENCPEGYEVDHIFPLQGEDVCGLHIGDNLQYLTISENRQKSNRRGEL